MSKLSLRYLIEATLNRGWRGLELDGFDEAAWSRSTTSDGVASWEMYLAMAVVFPGWWWGRNSRSRSVESQFFPPPISILVAGVRRCQRLRRCSVCDIRFTLRGYSGRDSMKYLNAVATFVTSKTIYIRFTSRGYSGRDWMNAPSLKCVPVCGRLKTNYWF